MTHKTLLTLSLTLALFMAGTQAGDLYDHVKSYVTIFNEKNFEKQVTNNRAKGISIVHFYKEGGISLLFLTLTYRWSIERSSWPV